MSTGPESPLDDDIRSVQIGPYRILDVLGEGGMGTVYLAEQQEPVTRRVALKVIKLGMDSKAVVARFEQERQTLALMQHDGIAKVYDCGTTETGQPFFVMELVQGTPLTTFCDDARLTLAQRLQLLQQVCSAVQHAHQKGIVHRDLKPGNVLVTEREGKLQAKVIDFGLAKAIGQSPLDATLLTAVGQIVGTPEYMAPEQADPTNLDIDTRADVYSLGVMLYELLVGRVPFPLRDLRNAGLLEMQRILREVEPPRPSTNLRASAGATAFAAETRRMSPSALRRALEQDLDWVVLKALDKDRNRRYETPANLAEDLQRFLDDQPVAAGPPSLGHRVRKFVRRHRTQVMVTTIVGMTAVVSAFVVIRERWRAERDSLAARTIAAAETSFQLAQQALRRGEWQQALDSYSEAATLGYQDHFAIDIGEVQALNGIEPADARTRLARIDERALAPAQRAKLLLLRGGLTTDWTKNPDAGFATLLMARETRTLSKADDLYAQALLEPDLRKAWPLLQAALVDDPGHPDALRVALPVSVFAGTSRDMLALVHQYSGACPGDRRLPLMRAIALLLNEQPLDEAAIETELKRSDVAEVAGLLLPMLRLIADLRIAQARSSDALPPRDAFQKALPLVRAALANPSSGDWPFVLHPSLVRCAPHLKKFLGGAFLGMAIDKPLRDLEALVPDRFWELMRARTRLLTGDSPGAWEILRASQDHPSFIPRLTGLRMWNGVLLDFEARILGEWQRKQAAGGTSLTSEANQAIQDWARRVVDSEDLPPSLLADAVQGAMAQGDNTLALEASLRRIRRDPAAETSAKFWLVRCLNHLGAQKWARALSGEMLANTPGDARFQADCDFLDRCLRLEVAYPQLAARLRTEAVALCQQAEATEALATNRRALLWLLTQWEIEEPGKGHGEEATALRQELGLPPH